ncbi:cellular communication/signal transduction protein [Fimbriiglobus ruber]|uniref:Cellular communication/signal transduction protein n=1 Tax=Fimbriiglobus ruber TaxID=1908690 RepID=A0A225E146_9BACT|nr:cellular communication/signal transduction protein [Fimbriiglobus ruber]
MNLRDENVADEISTWMFFRALRASRLLSAETLEELERRVREEPLADVLRDLIDRGVFTQYQVDRLKAGKHHGLVIGQYHILGELGQGGCGVVYKARHALMDRVVALKVISSDLCKNKTARDLFLREVVTTTRLAHPNIATAYDADEFEGQVFFVIEFVEGPTLHAYVTDRGALPVPVACSVLLETAQALQHANENGIVHRDIKPANILLPGLVPQTNMVSGTLVLVKVVDFGLASFRQGGRGIITTIPCEEGAAIGTPAFIAPEQITDVHKADIRSDLYSLGCSLYFALAGRLPFDGMTSELTLFQHLDKEPTPLRSLQPSVPAPLAAIVHRLMAKNPAQRFQTPADLIAALNCFVLSGGLGFPEARSDGPSAPPDQWETDVSRNSRHPTRATAMVQLRPAPPSSQPLLPRPGALGGRETVAEFRRLWREWCAVVEDCVRGTPNQVTDGQYKTLYRALTAVLRDVSECSALPPEQIDRARSLIEPWVTRASLVNLEYKMLASMWRSCRATDADLWPEQAQKSANGWLMTAACVAFGLAGCVAVWLGLR